MTLTTHTRIHSILTWLFFSEVVLSWYKLCSSPDKLSLVTSKTEYSISYIWFIKTTSCAIVTILLYTMYGNKLKTFVSSSSLLLLFKKGLRSKTKYKTTFIRISAVQFESFFKHVRLCSISILFNGQSLKWLNVSAADNVNWRTPSFAYQLSMNNNTSDLSRVISSSFNMLLFKSKAGRTEGM